MPRRLCAVAVAVAVALGVTLAVAVCSHRRQWVSKRTFFIFIHPYTFKKLPKHCQNTVKTLSKHCHNTEKMTKNAVEN
jgi:hypothetical protein